MTCGEVRRIRMDTVNLDNSHSRPIDCDRSPRSIAVFRISTPLCGSASVGPSTTLLPMDVSGSDNYPFLVRRSQTRPEPKPRVKSTQEDGSGTTEITLMDIWLLADKSWEV